MRIHPESGVVLSDKGDWPLLWDDNAREDSLATVIDQDTLFRAWQTFMAAGGDQAALTSVAAGLQSAWLRFLFPIRDKSESLEEQADRMRDQILEMMQQLERIELVGWCAPAIDRTDGEA